MYNTDLFVTALNTYKFT